MSLILDALRRADAARERDLKRRLSHGLPPRARRSKAWFWPALVLILVATILAMAFWLRPSASPESASITLPTTPMQPESHPVVTDTPRGSTLSEIPIPEPIAITSPAPMPRSNAPLLHELPTDLRLAIPAVNLNAHFWSNAPERRFILLDMRRYREGETLANGLRVVTILPEGVELDWRGTRFRLLSQ